MMHGNAKEGSLWVKEKVEGVGMYKVEERRGSWEKGILEENVGMPRSEGRMSSWTDEVVEDYERNNEVHKTKIWMKI